MAARQLPPDRGARSADVRQDLPAKYYRELPKLAPRELAGSARVHAMALELVRHSDGRLDPPRLTRFVAAYQTVAPLTIGELWAWPSMLKLALVEDLRRLAEEILDSREARVDADAATGALRRRRRPPAVPVLPATAPVPSRCSSCSACANTARALSRLRAPLEERLGRQRPHPRGRDPRRAPAPGHGAGLGGQRHHQPAPVLHARLEPATSSA